MATDIIISRKDFNGSPVCLNGLIIPLPLNQSFSAGNGLLEILDHAGIPYSKVVPEGEPTGRIILMIGGLFGGRAPITVNGITYFLPIGTPITVNEGVKEVLLNSNVPFSYERSTGTAPSPVSIILPTAQWDSDFSATGDATGWPDGSYDLPVGITVTITGGTYTAEGTPA